MSNPVKKIIDAVKDTVEDVVEDIWDEAVRVTKKIVKETTRITYDTVHFVAIQMTGMNYWCENCADFIDNVTKGSLYNLSNMVIGALDGDWVAFRDGFVGSVTTAIYVAALVVGCMTGNAWLISASIIALDAQHNQGALTHSALEELGRAEEMITGTTYITDNIDYIQIALVVASCIYAGGVGAGALSNLAGLSSTMAFLNSTAVQSALGGYQIYEAYETYEKAKEDAKEKLAQYEKYIKDLEAYTKAMKDRWFNIYADISNNEVLYEASAGGSLFNSGAGSNEYSPSTIHEQAAFILAYDIKKDRELDMIIDNSNVDFIQLGI